MIGTGDQPTTISCLSPPGRAALATIGLHGPRAWEAVRKIVRRPQGRPLPETPTPGRFWFAHAGDTSVDDVVLAVKSAEPLPLVEIHCHGGKEVVRFLTELFVADGLTPCSWSELLHENEHTRQAAVVLAHAQTMRTASIALDQFHGAFEREWRRIATLREQANHPAAMIALQELARHAPLGRRLTTPWIVAVAGPPNVGKSSLVNALAGYQRSIVSPIAGTTRDVVGTRLAIDGWPVELQDTAGIRTSTDEIEAVGIEQAHASVRRADLCLWLLDASAPPVMPQKQDPATLLIINKIDLAPAWEVERLPDALRVSCLTGQGIEELLTTISHRLVPDPPAPGSAVPFTPELCDTIEEALLLLNAEKSRRPLINHGETP